MGVEFGYTANDTLAIVHCDDAEIAVGTAYEKWSDNSWHAYSETPASWGVNVAHLMLPVICPTVGVSEQSSGIKMQLYPNPSNTVLNIVLPNAGNTENVSFRILNMLGAEVNIMEKQSGIAGVYRLDVSNLNAGFYFVEVTTSNGKRTEKFQVSR